MTIVLDSSAVLAAIKREPGGADVSRSMGQAIISTANLAETATVLVRDGADFSSVKRALGRMPFLVEPLDQEIALRAAQLISVTKPFGLSLGDRICLALAEARDAEAWTADRRWLDAGLPVRIHLIR